MRTESEYRQLKKTNRALLQYIDAQLVRSSSELIDKEMIKMYLKKSKEDFLSMVDSGLYKIVETDKQIELDLSNGRFYSYDKSSEIITESLR